MPRGRPKKGHNTPDPIKTVEPTIRFPFENEVVIRPVPSVFQDQILPSARFVIPPVVENADWADLVAQEKEKVKALKKTSKTISNSSEVDESNDNKNTGASLNNQSLILSRGTVIDYSTASGRIPELWTISYPLIKSCTNEENGDGSKSSIVYTERITRNELVTAKAVADKILSAPPLLITAFPLTTLQKYMTAHLHIEKTLQERIDLGMETAIQHSILWKLILVASCELEREFQIQKAFEETKKRLELQLHRQQEELKKNSHYQHCDCPKYYNKHPTTYMGGHFTKESTSTETTAHMGGDLNDNSSVTVYSSTMSPQLLTQRIKLGVSKAYDYFSRVYSTPEYDKDFSSIPESLFGFEYRRRSARVVSSTTNTSKEESSIDPIQSMLPKEHEAGGAVGLAFLHLLDLIPPDVPRTIDFTALETYEQYLQREQVSHDQPYVSVLDIQLHQDNDDEDIVNPFYMPSPQSIMVHLGRKQKSMTPADIQTAICYATEDSIPLCFSVTPPQVSHINNEVPSSLSSTLRICLDCTSGDSLKDLPEMESSIFSKCRFALKNFLLNTNITDTDLARIKEERELRKQREYDRKQAEMEEYKREEGLWRLKKQYETWRFKSIQSGCTIWPSWVSYVGDKLKEIHKQSNLLEDGISLNGSKYLLTFGEVSQEKKSSTQEEMDAEIAAKLALELNTGADATLGLNEGQRRSRRAGRETNLEGISFYGSSSSLAPQQLLETIHRLVVTVYPKYITLFDLRKILINGHGDIKGSEFRRIRSALGKIVFRQGKVDRLLVTSDSDNICWSTLFGDEHCKGDVLVLLGPSHDHESTLPEPEDITNSMAMDESNGVVVSSFTLGELEESQLDEAKLNKSRQDHVDEIPQDQETIDGCVSAVQSVNINDEFVQASLHDFENEKKEIKILEAYMASLHRVELILRSLLLKKYRSGNGLQSVTPEIVAVAADEKDGEVDTSDTREIEELDRDGKIVWKCDPPHHLLGQVLFRTDLSETDTSNPSHKWYKVLDYTPSIPLTISTVSETTEGMRDNLFVERRIHFRVGPTYLSNRQASKRTFILTEAQVKAGVKAAQLESDYTSKSLTSKSMKHPLDGLEGLTFLLRPDDSKSSAFFYARMAGHDTFLAADRKSLDYRVFLIVDEINNIIDDGGSYLEPGKAFWASISTDASVVTPLHMQSKFKIMPQEYHSSTPAFAACEAVIEYLKSNIKIVPFLKPVDPIALQIPTYFDVIKKPMDLSTVEKNLINGEYGRIPPNDTFSSPISKMLNGPFYSHIMRIFDNAMTFNPPGDWIHNDAAQLKRLASKKMETLTLKAERETLSVSGSHGSLKRSLYKEVDSDGDVYEYESDYDDDNTGKRRKRRATSDSRHVHTGKSSSKVEDNSCRPIEGPVNIPESPSIGIFSDLPISSDARFFGLPQEWSCRLSKESTEKSSDEEDRHKLLLLQIQLDQKNLTRRSSRYQDAVTDNLLVNNSNVSDSNLSLEYFLADENFILKTGFDDNFARSRVHVESIRETLHEEYFARLYYKYFANNRLSPISATAFHYGEGEIHGLGYGMYTDNSFPPFFGRIIPIGFSPSQRDVCDLKWEIRQPFILPALRWVLRGLVQSGHLSEIEPLSAGLSDNITQVNDGVLLINNVYFTSNSIKPYDLIDVKEITRRKKAENAVVQEQIRPDVHLSDYEKARLERVERNKERLRTLGLL